MVSCVLMSDAQCDWCALTCNRNSATKMCRSEGRLSASIALFFFALLCSVENHMLFMLGLSQLHHVKIQILCTWKLLCSVHKASTKFFLSHTFAHLKTNVPYKTEN
jgi:hypothetical protein